MIGARELVEPRIEIDGVEAEPSFRDGDRPLVEPLGLSVTALVLIVGGETLEPGTRSRRSTPRAVSMMASARPQSGSASTSRPNTS